MEDYYHKRDIIHQKTCIETPQQNAIVERKHQHIFDVARALKFQSDIPMRYWNDCILSAVYLINRTPTQLLNKKLILKSLLNINQTMHTLKSLDVLLLSQP